MFLPAEIGKHFAISAATHDQARCCVQVGLTDTRPASGIETGLRIRITELPKPGELDEFDFRRLHVGEIYDLPAHFASVLLISGYAELAPPLRRRDRTLDFSGTEPEF